ncbi:helix-turn-helix transcriptional regulator [Alteromonas oceanisediminis]|uniref:helix-turn-helix transcriptional regulator n=1 Tax=Alteromonas oceanisediminis TaxID=2836180 RepID=UPI001BD9B2E6|nr:AlpA family phage regulatory protein [Alteromonas oceanisediminis]MBT0585112.1 AlpA family phage regulatory protein [Alteromonas oceanisediminis]
MSNTFHSKVIRRPETLALTGCSKTTLHCLQKKGLFVSPIPIGERAVGYLEHEVLVIIAARSARKSDSEIKSLVGKLEEQRKHSANALIQALVA